MKKALLLLISLFFLFSYNFAEDNKTVRIVCSIMDTSGTGYKSGYSYEYFQRIAYITGWKYEYVYADFSTALEMLKNGEVDIKDNLSYTEERAQYISFPDYPQGKEIYYLLSTENQAPYLQENLSNFNGKKVAVSKGSFQESVLKKWIEQHGYNLEIVETKGSAAAFEALDNGEVAAIVYPGTSDAKSYIPVANIGHSDFFFGVNQKRPDLLAELNEALRKIQSANPGFNDSLYGKYQSGDVTAQILAPIEREYIIEHRKLKIGILNDYLPFSDEDDGKITGVVTYLVDCLKDVAMKDYTPEVSFVTYEYYNDMVQGLKNNEVDVIFPVTSDFYYSEINQILESEEVFELPMSLIYRDYNESVTDRIAITKHSPSQRVYVDNNYPNSEIVEYDSPEQCFDAVLAGEVNSTVFNSFRSEHFFNTTKYWTLNEISLQNAASMCFAVNKTDNILLGIINKEIIKIDKNELINKTYDYLKVINTYTAEDYIREHRVSIFLSLSILILAVIVSLSLGIHHERRRKEAIKRSLFMETKHIMARLAIDEAMESGSWEMEFDMDGNFISCRWSDQFRRLLGYTDETDFPDTIESWSNLIVPEDKERSLQVLFDSAIDITGAKGYNLEHRLLTKNRGVRWFRAGGKAVKKVGEEGIIYYGAFQDINERKLAMEKAYSDSMNDALTGLGNRRAYDEFVSALEKETASYVCTISIDLNGLKTANDKYGHAAGDELIRGAAECLSKVFKDVAFVCRMGGDEFAVVSKREDVDFEQLATTLKEECMHWHGKFTDGLTLALGIASGQNVSKNEFIELTNLADEKMYADKDLFYKTSGLKRRSH